MRQRKNKQHITDDVRYQYSDWYGNYVAIAHTTTLALRFFTSRDNLIHQGNLLIYRMALIKTADKTHC
jgi:hypothetical protein